MSEPNPLERLSAQLDELIVIHTMILEQLIVLAADRSAGPVRQARTTVK